MPDTQVTTVNRNYLECSTLLSIHSSALHRSSILLGRNAFPARARVGVLSTYPPTLCGLATFTAALSDALCANGADVSVVRVADGSPSSSERVVGELVNGSATSVAAMRRAAEPERRRRHPA